MVTIKHIIAEAGEECNVDIDVLHDTLLKLPAEMYLNLYQKMHMRIYGYPPIMNYGGCCGTIGEKQPDIKIEVDDSEVDKATEKVEELSEKLEDVNSILSKLTGGKISIYASFAEDN